jgi:hypothetical protein
VAVAETKRFVDDAVPVNGLSPRVISLNGTIFNSIGTGLTTSAGALVCNTANGSTFGCLSSTDWNTFNSKVSSSSLSGASVISYTSGTGVITTQPGTFGGSGTYTFANDLVVSGNGTSSIWSVLTLASTTNMIVSRGATTTNLAIVGVAGGLLKTNAAGAVGLASAGTDYESPLTFAGSLQRTGNTVTFQTGSLTVGAFTATTSASTTNLVVSGTASTTDLYIARNGVIAGTATTTNLAVTGLASSSALRVSGGATTSFLRVDNTLVVGATSSLQGLSATRPNYV